MSLSRNKSASELPDFGHNNSFRDVHLRISLHQSKSIPFIANNSIISHPGSYNYVGNHTHDQSFSAWGPQIQDTESNSSTTTRETNPLVPAAIESPSCTPISLPRVENPNLIGEFPLENAAEPKVSVQSDTSQNTRNKDGGEDDWLEMAHNNQRPRTRSIVVAGPDICGLIEISDDEDLEYMSHRGQEFFFPGRLIGVYKSDTDSSISGRTMIVLSVSDHGFVQCLTLCRHEGHTGEERGSFYKAHVAVHRDTTSPPTAKHPKTINPSFEITLKKSGHNIKDSCYINFEHTWTLLEHVPVVDLGYVRKSQRKDLLITHGRIQNELRQRTMEVFELK